MELKASSLDQKVSEIDAALCRAALYSALAIGFRPPTEETIVRLVSRGGAAALLAAATPLDEGLHSGLAASAEHLVEAGGLSVAELSSSYRRLFGHTARGAVPPYETEYGTEALFQQPQELGDLMGFYRAFGLTLNPAEHERPDHVSCKCEFLCFLALKEIYAIEQTDAEMLEETCKATRLFLRDHLARFVPAFTKKLAREDPGGFYARLGELCNGFVIEECARLGVPLGPDHLSLRPASDERVPMACGSEAGCMAFPGAGRPEGMEEQ